MLTKTDLKQIRGVVREEVESEIENLKDGLETDILNVRVYLMERVRNLESRVKSSEIGIKREIKRIQPAK